jgi:glycosyltransferase involved in cell wall biosynthesis
MLNISKSSSWFIATRFMLRQSVIKGLYTDLKKPIANILFYSGIVLRAFGVKRGLYLILKSRRVDDVARANSTIRHIIQQGEDGKSEFSQLFCYSPFLLGPLEGYERRILILKLPVLQNGKVLEKGALIFKFNPTFIPMYLYLDADLLFKYFRLIFEPSWAGYSSEEILVWTEHRSEKIVVLSQDETDFEFLSEMDTNLIPVKLGAADWVNPETFYKIDVTEKKYDVIYLANFTSGKRVDRYIRAIVRISRIKSDYRAALVCAPPGFSQREVMATLGWAKNKAKITYFDAMPQSDLNKLLNQSKVNILLALKEGANKGLTEGLFSGTPAILISENIGVNRDSINENTGKIVPDYALEDTLIWFSEHYDEYKPEKWANEHISPTASTKILANKLKEIELENGRDWTVGLFPKVNEPELAYLHSKHDWLLSKRMELLTGFSKGADEKSIISFLEQLQVKAD